MMRSKTYTYINPRGAGNRIASFPSIGRVFF
ncbi:hypothetical protein BASH2_04780 [Bacillus anthracis]|nr:hypothetical protein BASH2_04780 [Bacillus anthracis]